MNLVSIGIITVLAILAVIATRTLLRRRKDSCPYGCGSCPKDCPGNKR